MPVRRAAKVERDLGTVKHYVGLPAVLTDGIDMSVRLPTADMVLIIEEAGGFLIYRYRCGELVGDTWHGTLEDAEGQLRFEFHLTLPWIDVPEAEPDPARFAIERLRSFPSVRPPVAES